MKKKYTVSLFLVISALAILFPALEVSAFGNPYTYPANYFYTPVTTPAKKNQYIFAYNKVIPVNCKPINLGAMTNGDGKLTYSSSSSSIAKVSSKGVVTPKNCGIATITIKAAETKTFNEASVKITVTVLPKTMKLNSVKSTKKKRLEIKWGKDNKVNGYEVQICSQMDFRSGTFSKSFGKGTLKTTVKDINSQYWFVRIRSWKTFAGTKLYGGWSAVKRVKVK